MHPRFSQLESLLLAMKDGVLLVNHEREIAFMNPSAMLILKAPTNSPALSELPEHILSLAEHVLQLGKEAECDLETSQAGEARQFHVSLRPVSVSIEGVDERTMALIVLHEVTRLHRLENLRREFVANVSHELKTPITSIKAAVETLQDGAVNDSVSMPKFLDIIARQSDRLNVIIEDLLSLSRLENEREEVLLLSGCLSEVIEEAINACESKARAKNIRLRFLCSSDIQVRMNSNLLEQAIVNLVDNAIKYSGEGTMIAVEARANNGTVEIDVKDQGPGIAPEHHARIFERFYRVDRARSRSAGGSGLGLSIVKHIAQVHGGQASVSSVVGKGSTFSLTLSQS